jgi:hypothetical protein
MVRTRANPDDLAAAVRSQLWAIDKRMSAMDRLLADSLAGRRSPFAWAWARNV